jgi:Uma2 family endonuclease
MIAEVAHSTRAIDLHQKRLDYQQAGVREYLVLSSDASSVPAWARENEDAVRLASAALSIACSHSELIA